MHGATPNDLKIKPAPQQLILTINLANKKPYIILYNEDIRRSFTILVSFLLKNQTWTEIQVSSRSVYNGRLFYRGHQMTVHNPRSYALLSGSHVGTML